MRRKLAFLSVMTAAFWISSCGPSLPPDTRAADEAALSALDEQWAATAAKKDLEATVAFYSDNAVLLAPNAPIAKDKKSIRESWAGLLEPNTEISWKVSKAEVAKSGELGYVYGAYRLSIKDPKGGLPVNDTGKFLEVWKKEATGAWKCIVDTYNSDIPVPAVPEVKK